MHELSIAESLIEQVRQVAEREHADRVARITVDVGPLSGVDPQALETAFPVAAEHTVAEHAELAIECTGATATCRACSHTFTPQLPLCPCPQCGSLDADIDGGRDLLLKAVELGVRGGRG